MGNMNVKLIGGLTFANLGDMVICSWAKIVSFPCVTFKVAKITHKKIKHILAVACGIAFHIPGGSI